MVAFKLHFLVQLPFLNIPCMDFTDGAAADAPMLKRLVRQLGMKDIEKIALDSAYLARWVCDMLAKSQEHTDQAEEERHSKEQGLASMEEDDPRLLQRQGGLT
jgi:hypothetical protein